MLLYILIGFLVILKLVNLWKNKNLIKLSRELKTDCISFPFIGHAYKFIGNDEDIMKGIQCFGKEAIKHNGLTSWWIGRLFISVAEPVSAECLLKRFLEKGQIYAKVFRHMVGNANLTAPVNIWRSRRRILTPNFTPQRLNQFVKVFVEQSNTMVEELRAKADAGPFSVWDYLTTYTLDVVIELLTGHKLQSQKDHDHPVLKNFQVCSKLLATRIFSPWQHNDMMFKLFPACNTLKEITEFAEGFTYDIIAEVRKSMELSKLTKSTEANNETMEMDTDYSHQDHQKLKTVMEMLIETSGGDEGYSDLELREEIIIVGIAAVDTSAVGSAFTLLMLARYQDIQHKVHKELNEVFDDSKRPITPEDLPRLKYLEAVVNEALRLYPPVPIVTRDCDEDFILPSGLKLVKGCELLINIWALHRNPEYWGDDAEEFRPERFLDTPFKHPAQFMPFSSGPRNCIGYRYAMMSMKTNLATLLRSYWVLPGTPTAPGGQHKPLRLKYDIMMKDIDGFKIQLQHKTE